MSGRELGRLEVVPEDVLAGLAKPQKELPPKYFYDARGCALFEAICGLPEYYLTRAETALMRARGAAPESPTYGDVLRLVSAKVAPA